MFELIPRFVHEEPTVTLALTYLSGDHLSNENRIKSAYKALVRRWLRTVASERQNHFCCYCGRETNDIVDHDMQATLDHLVPVSKGGQDTLENSVMACAKCNRKRGNENAEEFWEKRQRDFAGKNRRGNRMAGPSFEVCSYTA